MQAVLILPKGATVTSGNDQAFIGTMNGGTSTTVSWTVVFEKNGTYTLQVRVSGYDSNSSPCPASQSTTITVGEGSPPPTPFDALYAVLIAIGIILVVILASALMLRKHKK